MAKKAEKVMMIDASLPGPAVKWREPLFQGDLVPVQILRQTVKCEIRGEGNFKPHEGTLTFDRSTLPEDFKYGDQSFRIIIAEKE